MLTTDNKAQCAVVGKSILKTLPAPSPQLKDLGSMDKPPALYLPERKHS